MKRFYKWLKGNNVTYPEEVKWITTTLKTKNRLLPENLLTEEEIQRLIDVVDRPRDKAFIITLYESGPRIGELGSLRLGDVEFDERYAKLMLRGKTGARRVILVAALLSTNMDSDSSLSR